MELQHGAFQATSKSFEETLARQEDLRAAKERLSSQTIGVDELPDVMDRSLRQTEVSADGSRR